MKVIKRYLLNFAFTIAIASYCESQNIQYRSKIRPNIKAKLDSIYPHASDIILNQSIISDSTQTVELNCNCGENSDIIVLIFDTSANLRYKETHYNSTKKLPDTLKNCMKKYAAIPNVKVFNEMYEYTNRKGEITYSIMIQEYATPYILRFKPSGEFISKEVVQGGEQ